MDEELIVAFCLNCGVDVGFTSCDCDSTGDYMMTRDWIVAPMDVAELLPIFALERLPSNVALISSCEPVVVVQDNSYSTEEDPFHVYEIV